MSLQDNWIEIMTDCMNQAQGTIRGFMSQLTLLDKQL